MKTTEAKNSKRSIFLGDWSGFVASTYRVTFKLQEKQIPNFGKLCPTILSRASFYFLIKLLYLKPYSELVKNIIQVLLSTFPQKKKKVGGLNYNQELGVSEHKPPILLAWPHNKPLNVYIYYIYIYI